MRLRLVSPMASKGSPNAYFVKRIPTDLVNRMVGKTLVIPLAESSVSFTVMGRASSIVAEQGAHLVSAALTGNEEAVGAAGDALEFAIREALLDVFDELVEDEN